MGKQNKSKSFCISDAQWENILALELDLPAVFNGLSDSCTQSIDQWSQWMQSKEPHRTPLPGKWGMEPKDAITGNDGSEVKEEEVDHIVYGLTAFRKC